MYKGARKVTRRVLSGAVQVLVLIAVIYLALGLGFHFAWKSAQEACRQAREAAGEFVEPEVFWWPIGLAFDITFWPAYAWANMYHDGTPFATPCTH